MAILQRILYVEDDLDIQAIARLALEKVGGFDVMLCSSGEQALIEAADFDPDMILLDVMMPGMDGISTLAALREQASLVDVPVAFVTAKVQPEEVERYRSLGASDVIRKPFDPMLLSDRVSEIWELSLSD